LRNSLIFLGVASHSFGGYRQSPYLVSLLVCWFVQDLMHIQRCDSPDAKVLMLCFSFFLWLGFGFMTSYFDLGLCAASIGVFLHPFLVILSHICCLGRSFEVLIFGCVALICTV